MCLISYFIKRDYNSSDIDNPKWVNVGKIPGAMTKANVTLPIRTPTEVRITAVNAIGQSNVTGRLVKPPLYYHTGKQFSLKQSLNRFLSEVGNDFILSLKFVLIKFITSAHVRLKAS